MIKIYRPVIAMVLGLASAARAQAPATTPTTTTTTTAPPPPLATDASSTPAEQQPKQPRRGDFDAGGQVRLPSGPDEANKFATYNWIALDLKGRYYLLDTVTVDGNIPLAVHKPDLLADGTEPKMIGGMTVRLDAKLPKLPKLPFTKYDTEIGLSLTVGYMHEGAMLLSDKDYPLFVGDFKPGVIVGPIARIKLSNLIDFATQPVWVYQAGTMDALTAVQIPTSTIVKLGSLVQLSADLGVYTGDDYSFSGKDGGRISAGGSLTVKLGPILAHAGAGVASLLTGGLYPSIGDSVYVDLNVKYAK